MITINGQTSIFLLDLKGTEHPAIAEVNRKKRVNGQREISLSFLYDDINADFIHDIEFGWKILFKGEWYTITGPSYALDGDTFSVGVDAVLSFFVDMNGHYLQDEVEDKSMTPANFFRELFEDTGYSFVLVDNLAANTLNYQANQSKTERFLYGVDRFNGEYVIRGKTAYIHGLIGSDKDVILHEDLNIQDVSIEVDASGFHTWARGFGDKDDNEEDADYKIEVEEHIPALVEKYGWIEGPAIRDGSYKHEDNLKDAIKKQIENSAPTSTTITAVDLTNNGYPEMQFEEGDRVFLYVTDLKQNQQVRVVEIDETFDWEGNIIDAQYTVGNEGIAARYKTQQYDTIKDFRDIASGRKTLEYNWLPEAIKRASDIINGNIDSRFRYGAGEIIGINESNPNGYMRFNTDGIGFSRDGGKTYRSAMTYEGIVADAITAGTLRGVLIEGVDIIGSRFFTGSDKDYTKLENSNLESRGQFKRTWLGVTTNYDVKTKLENGYLRFRNDSLERSLYLSEFGFSTYVDGTGEVLDSNGSSGSIYWWDKTYSTEYKGITINSHAGSPAMSSNLNKVIIQPMAERSNKFFHFTKSTDGNDLYMLLSTLIGGNPEIRGGIRIVNDKKGSVHIVDSTQSTGGDTSLDVGNINTNNIFKRSGSTSVYWNNTSGGTTSDPDPGTTLRASGIRTRSGDSVMYLATDSGGHVSVTDYKGHNSGNGVTFRPIYSSEFKQTSNTSGIMSLLSLRPEENEASRMISDLDIERKTENGNPAFFLYGETPVSDGEGTDLSKAVMYLVKSQQETIERLDKIEGAI